MTGYHQPDPSASADGRDLPIQFYEERNLLNEPHKLSSANLSRWLDLDSDHSTPKGTARRRRLPAGSDHVKHRRTRSGCYTCRSRRVKCDEQHPVCERCKKGARECVYPEPPSATKSSGGSKLGQPRKVERESDSSSGEYEDDEPESLPTGSINSPPNRTTSRQSSTNHLKPTSRKQSRRVLDPSKTSSVSTDQLKEKSLSPSTDDSSVLCKSRSTSSTFNRGGKLSSASTNTSQELAPWSHLSHDLQYYLDYHQQYLNYHHYFFKHDASEFVSTILLNSALNYEPLLYAVVGFAAFNSTLKKNDGKIQDFLGYYNKSVSLLRKSLSSGQRHTDATMMTILQLAAFEEYLGDWVNLLGHQKAAYEMLLELYTPQNIMQTEARRKILAWYARFDLFAGIMSGYEIVLSRDWFCAYEDYYKRMSIQDSTNIDHRIEANIAAHRVTAMDMALLFSKLPRGAISTEEFIRENQLISDSIAAGKADLDDIIASQDHIVKSFEGAPERDPDDIVDPYKPGGLYQGPFFTINFLLLDYQAVYTVHQYQTALMLQLPAPPDLLWRALEQCRIFEAIERWPGSPPGAILPAQASLGVAGLFLPKDERHTLWCRRKFAMVESLGYILPPTFRSKMSELWNIPELHHWWLPNDEGYPPIVRSIRAFIEERTLKPRNQPGEDVRNMKGMFSKMSIFDESPRESPTNSPESSTGGVEVQSQLPHNSIEGAYSQRPEIVFDESLLDTSEVWGITDFFPLSRS